MDRHEPALADTVVLTLTGEVDSAAAYRIRAAFAEVGRTNARVVVMLDEVSFIDSAGLGALIGGSRRVRDQGGVVVLCKPRPAIRSLLHTTGVDRVVPVVDDLAAAARRALDEMAASA